MNLSELVEVYGKADGGDGKQDGKTGQESNIGKKTGGHRNANGQRAKTASRAGRRPAAQAYQPVVVPPMASFMPYDPVYGSQYGAPVFYGHPMVMMMPYPDPNAYHNPGAPMMLGGPNTAAAASGTDPTATPSQIASSSSSGNSSATSSSSNPSSSSFTSSPPPTLLPSATRLAPTLESIPPMGHMPFAPNFVAPAYAPSYMYPYDPGYQYGYAPPPQKRAKRLNNSGSAHSHQHQSQHSGSSHGSNHHAHRSGSRESTYTSKVPQSPNSDSADSSSSNTSSAPSTPAIGSISEKPEKPKKFHCEPCEKGFKTQQQYDAHLTTHVPCPYEGCTYSAVRASLKLHELLHINNMFSKLSTPEEIAKYREERKKKFPSFARAQAAEAAAAEALSAKQAAAEANAAAAANGEEVAPSAGDTVESTSDDLQGAGTRAKRKRPTCKYWKQGNCNKGDQCSFSHSNVASEGEPKSKKQKNVEGPNTGRHRSSVLPRDPKKDTPTSTKNLLTQFLQSEINKENKVVLQCLRFLVSKNFFNKTQVSSTSSAPASYP